MDKHDLLRSSFQKLNDDTASTAGGLSVPSIASYANNQQQKTGAKNGKYIDKFTLSIEVLARKNLEAASMANAETRKDREQRNTAFILEIEEKRIIANYVKTMQQRTESIKEKVTQRVELRICLQRRGKVNDLL